MLQLPHPTNLHTEHFFSIFLLWQRSSLPKFLIRGHLNTTNCVITQPLAGELVVESSAVAIKSIELQLVRVETCGQSLLPVFFFNNFFQLVWKYFDLYLPLQTIGMYTLKKSFIGSSRLKQINQHINISQYYNQRKPCRVYRNKCSHVGDIFISKI